MNPRDGVVLRLLPHTHSHHPCQLPVSFRSQRLCQTVCHYVLRWAILQPSCSIFNAIPDEVILDVDMLYMSVVFWIVGKCDSALIVVINDVLVADVVADFSEETQEPGLLLERVE